MTLSSKIVLPFFLFLFACCTPEEEPPVSIDPEPDPDPVEPEPQPVVPVRIMGVDWAPYNVAEAGRFTARVEDFGGLFPWGAEVCPEGWRVPTSEELFSLLSTDDMFVDVWATRGDTQGLAVRSIMSSEGIFLPAAGFLRTTEEPAEPSGVNERGYYWSSSSNLETSGVNLQISQGSTKKSMGNSRQYGYSVRCCK